MNRVLLEVDGWVKETMVGSEVLRRGVIDMDCPPFLTPSLDCQCNVSNSICSKLTLYRQPDKEGVAIFKWRR